MIRTLLSQWSSLSGVLTLLSTLGLSFGGCLASGCKTHSESANNVKWTLTWGTSISIESEVAKVADTVAKRDYEIEVNQALLDWFVAPKDDAGDEQPTP